MSAQSTSSLKRASNYLTVALITLVPWLLLWFYAQALWAQPGLTIERTKLVFCAFFIVWSVIPHLWIWTLKDPGLKSRAVQRQASIYMIKKIPKALLELLMSVLAFYVVPVLVFGFVKRTDTILPGIFQKLFGDKNHIDEDHLPRIARLLRRRSPQLAHDLGDPVLSQSWAVVYGTPRLSAAEDQFGTQLLVAENTFEIAALYALGPLVYQARWGCKVADISAPWDDRDAASRGTRYPLVSTSVAMKGSKALQN